MKIINITLEIALLILLGVVSITAKAQRDPYLQPFAVESIWNMPIHKDAVYVDAQMNKPTAWGMTADPDQIIIAPNAPAVNVYKNGWSKNDRCSNKGGFMTTLHLPNGYQQGLSSGNTCAAVLDPDGVTFRQIQSLHRCNTTGDAYALVEYPSNNIYGEGITGSHGGAGMSAIGGTIRMGEIIAESTAFNDPEVYIHHAIKMNVFAKLYLKNVNDGTPGYRWPAPKADGYANQSGEYDGSVNAMEIGALLAIPKSVNVENMGLETVPGKIIARTLQRYGAYIVDDTAWDVVAIEMQDGPHGDAHHEFADHYGFSFSPQSRDVPWSRDIAKIVEALYVIDNNSATTKGGGPNSDYVNRLAPMACAIGTPGSGIKCFGSSTPVAVSSVSVQPTTLSISKGTSQAVVATISPANATNKNVTWSSSNTAIATVNAQGVVSALANGNTTITAKTQDGNFTATTIITVVTPDPTTNYFEDFNDGLAQGWQNTTGTWTLSNNEYNNTTTAAEEICFYGGATFTNYTFSAKANPSWDNDFGLVYNYQDANNFLAVVLDANPKNAYIKQKVNGIWTTLATITYTGGAGQWNTIEVTVDDGKSSVKINGSTVFNTVTTSQFTSGKIGLYSGYNPVKFDDVDVKSNSIITAIETAAELSNVVYPNPFTSSIHIDTIQAWSLYSTSGQLIKKGYSDIVEGSELSQGMYLLRLENGTVIRMNK